MKKVVTICFCTLILIPIVLYSRSIWVERNLYSSADNLRVGDIVTVVVNDVSRLQFEVSLKNNTSNSVDSNPDVNITGFLPIVSGNRSTKSGNDLNYSERRRMTFSIGTRIQAIDPNGRLTIAGTRVYGFNGVSNTVTVNGVIDSTKIKSGLVDSADVADFRLNITASSDGIRIQRPPLAEDETGELTLTEQEKRDILIRYFEEMINALER